MTAPSFQNAGRDALAEQLFAFEAALERAPTDAALYRIMSELQQRRGDELATLAYLIGAETFEARDRGEPYSTMALCNVATGYFMKGEHESAERWYRRALLLSPDLAVAYQNLAAIHADAGRLVEANACRERAYGIQRVFVEEAGTPTYRVLVLCVGKTAGNVPFEILMPHATCCRIKYVIDYAADDEDDRLPPFDLVFNGIGEPDVAISLMDRLARFSQRCARPLLNAPISVMKTQRHRLTSLLDDLEDVVLAQCVRHEEAPASSKALAKRLAAGGIEFPVLARPEASHGGNGLVCCENLPALMRWFIDHHGSHYLTAFRDYRSADGFYRKYRVIFIDREPYPYHLAISSHWMVHYASSEMIENPWKIDEEGRFLQDPVAALGVRAMNAIRAVGQRLDLDYVGIDFTCLPDGRIFVFEANATMLVHWLRLNGPLSHKNDHVQRIVDAFGHMLSRRAPRMSTSPG